MQKNQKIPMGREKLKQTKVKKGKQKRGKVAKEQTKEQMGREYFIGLSLCGPNN